MSDVKLSEWGAILFSQHEGVNYDANSLVARKRRDHGLCGYCGHPAHFRMAGCSACQCPVLSEVSPEQAEAIASVLAGRGTEGDRQWLGRR
jgi:hypothetical protein